LGSCELWLDGGWEKKPDEWGIPKLYDCVKKHQPDCAVGVNWTIGLPEDKNAQGVLPKDQKAGYPFRYFPSDFRLGDPHLPVENDPKLFSHEGESYYLPFESTICLNDKWFFNTTDEGLKKPKALAAMFKRATAEDNVCIFNSPPTTMGLMPEKNIQLLKQVRELIKI